MQDKQGSMLLAHFVAGCVLPFIFCWGGIIGIMGILGIIGILGMIGNRHNR